MKVVRPSSNLTRLYPLGDNLTKEGENLGQAVSQEVNKASHIARENDTWLSADFEDYSMQRLLRNRF